MYTRYLICCWLGCFLGGCTREVVIDVKESPSKIVVQSVTAAGDLFEVYVGKSYSIFSERTNVWNDAAENAVVSVYENGVLAEVLPFSESSRTYKAVYARPVAGNSYRIEVSRPEYATVTATSIVPEIVPIDSLIVENEIRQLNGQYQTGLRISFTDIEGDNYYSIVLTDPGGYSPCLYCRDAAIEKVNDLDLFELEFCYRPGELLLSDQSFQNREKQVQTYVDEYYVTPNPDHATIALQHITHDYFRFLATKNLNRMTSGNPFAEPANVVSNITNGFGIFTVYSSSVRNVE